MKIYSADGYKAMGISGGHYLAEEAHTIDAMKSIIDASNKRNEELGYKQESWIIINIGWCTWCDDDGMFIKRETLEKAVEIYPEL